MNKISVCPCFSPTFFVTDASGMGYILQWGCGVSAALFFILLSTTEHVVPWGSPNAFGRSRRERFTVSPLQRVVAAHLSPHIAGMIQINPRFVCSFHPCSPWGNVKQRVRAWAQQMNFHLDSTEMKDGSSLQTHFHKVCQNAMILSKAWFTCLFLFVCFLPHSDWGSYLAVCSFIQKATSSNMEKINIIVYSCVTLFGLRMNIL